MKNYPFSLYKEVLKFYEYETRNKTINGNAVRSEMECSESSSKLWTYEQGDEDYI